MSTQKQTIRVLYGASFAMALAIALLEATRFNDSILYGTPGEAIVFGSVSLLVSVLCVTGLAYALRSAHKANTHTPPSYLPAMLLVFYAIGMYRNSIVSSYPENSVRTLSELLGLSDMLLFVVLMVLQTGVCAWGIVSFYNESDYRKPLFGLAVIVLLLYPSVLFSIT